VRHGSFPTILIGVVCFIGAYIIFSLWQIRPDQHPFDGAHSLAASPAMSGSHEEVVVVLVVSALCGASNDPRLPQAWRAIVAAETEVASGSAYGFRVIGSAIGNPAGAGVSFLEGFGPFDEVTSGRGWEAIGGMMFLFGDLVGPSAVPQVVKIRRTVVRREVGGPHIEDVRVVGRWVGVDPILALAQR